MKTTLLTIGLLWAACRFLLAADSDLKLAEAQKVADGLQFQQGEVALDGGFAKLEVPADFRFLGAKDAADFLIKVWQNPPTIEKPLGLLLPSGADVMGEDCWAVVITYHNDGYVKDDDAQTIDYAKLLSGMQKQMREANPERVKQGYPAMELVGWAEPPHYDAAARKLYWAKELKVGDASTLNYNVRILGRRGVLVLNAVARMDQLPQVEEATPKILGMVDFTDGNRYADFKPGADKVATYGLAALVAGGVAAKLGLFKVLLGFLIALKKFVIIGVVALGAFLKRIVQGRGRKPSPPSDPPTPA